MREIIALPLTESDFQQYLESVKKRVEHYKSINMGYISITCQLAKDVTEEDPRWSFTSSQLKRIFDLAN